jgi:hypothetical protein
MTGRAKPAGRRTTRAHTGPSPSPPLQATRLAAALQALAHGLPNPWDESTDYFRGFAAVLPARAELDADGLRAALGIGPRYEINLSPADQILTALGNAQADWGDDIANGFRQLGHVMRATLGELSLAFARGRGVVRVRVWLFGRSEDGTLVGLHSLSTET